LRTSLNDSDKISVNIITEFCIVDNAEIFSRVRMDNRIDSLSLLDLPVEEMRRLGYALVEKLIERHLAMPALQIQHPPTRAELERKLREPLPERGIPIDDVLAQLDREVWPNVIPTNHPRFFAFVSTPNNFVSVLADALSAAMTAYAGSWLEAAGPAMIELVVIEWLRQLVGMPEGTGGHCVTGGSVANLTALAVARHAKLQDRVEGATLYCSDQTHGSIRRAFRILGFQFEQMRIIPTNARFEIDVTALEQAIARDRTEGKRPFCVVATAGTTNTGSIDPLAKLAGVCARENLWLHVDGSYGAAIALTARGPELLSGIERVDSLTLDPHKWWFQPYELGCVLIRQPHLLREAFQYSAEYLQDTQGAHDEINFGDEGLQFTRTFRALKLWMSLKVFGVETFRRAVQYGVDLGEHAEKTLRASSCWEILSCAQIGVIVFRYIRPGLSDTELNHLNHAIAAASLNDGFAFVTSTTLRGLTALRFCTINPRTTFDDIRQTIARLETCGNRL
ncbi:MAG: pyridoxal phosphate-dependent decarboxylase family protein, partial [bacterium]